MLVASKVRLRLSLLVAMMAGAPAAIAALPDIADRVPANAPVVITVSNLESFMGQMGDIQKIFAAGEALGDGPLAELEKIKGTAGLKKDGAVAMVVMPEVKAKDAAENEEAPPKMVIYVPVTDYDAFVTGLGGDTKAAIASINLDGQPSFAKNIGGGYALISTAQDVLESFPADTKGQREGHLARAGARGRDVIERSDLIVLADIQSLKPVLQEGVKEMQEQAGAMSGMMGGDMGDGGADEADAAAESAKAFTEMSDALIRDGKTAVGGISLANGHIVMHMGAQFNEGTPLAGTFADPGNASPIMNNLPATPFIMAFAADTSTPGFRKFMDDMQKMQEEGGLGELNRLMTNMAEGTTGSAFIMGFNPMALMGGGLFINSAQFTATKDPSAVMASARQVLSALNGQENEVGTITTTYEADAVEVSGVKASKSTMKIVPGVDSDPMIGQLMAMMMGPTQQIEMLSAPVEGGVVTAMSNNPPLLASAIDAAKGGNNLGKDAGITTIRELLPKNRVMEAFVGTKSILDSVGPFLAMAGVGEELDVPVSMNPMGFGITSGEGGMSMSMVIPADNLKAFADIAQQMQALQGGGDEMGGDEEGGAPAF